MSAYSMDLRRKVVNAIERGESNQEMLVQVTPICKRSEQLIIFIRSNERHNPKESQA